MPEIIKDTCSIEKVEYYVNDSLTGISESEPHTYTLQDSSWGEVVLQARVVEKTGAYKWSGLWPVTISDGSPEAQLTAPGKGNKYDLLDTVKLAATSLDYDGTVDSVQFFAGSSYLGSSKIQPFEFTWENPLAGQHKLSALAWDDSLNKGRSEPVSIRVYGYRKADSTGTVKPGLIYDFYRGNWSYLPEFSRLSSRQKDTVSSFNIDNYAGNDHFALRIAGYISVPEKGIYNFYTESDDGSRLYIGDRLIVDNDGRHGPLEKGGRILLDQGLHSISVGMFEYDGGEDLQVSWQGPGIDKREIPASALFRPAGSSPRVSIVEPVPGTIYNQGTRVPFRVSVSDPDDDIHHIEWYKNNTLLNRYGDTSTTLATDTLSPGRHTFTAKAYDLGGSVSETPPVTIIINGTPEVQLTAPVNRASFTSRDTIPVRAVIRDDNPRQLRFYLNEQLVRSFTTSPWSFELSGLDRGRYYVKSTLTDANGLEATDKLQFTVVNTPPEVSIIKPDSGAVFAPGEEIELQAGVSDPDGDVYKVAFYEDGRQIGDDANYFYVTRVENLSEGKHSITAKAFDKAGAVSASQPVVITVGTASAIERWQGAYPRPNDYRLFLYPNPLEEGSLYLESPQLFSRSGEVQVFITDVTGKEIFRQSFDLPLPSISIPIRNFPGEGLFFITIRSETGVFNKKIMVR